MRPERLTDEIGAFLDHLLGGPAPRCCVADAARRLGFRSRRMAHRADEKERRRPERLAPGGGRPARPPPARTLQIGGGVVLGTEP